jgi:hypothetical protein
MANGTSHANVRMGKAHHKRLCGVAGCGGGGTISGIVLNSFSGVNSVISLSIVALSNSDVTIRAVVVAFLACIAIFLLGRGGAAQNLIDKFLSNGANRAPQPVLVRVDRRQQPVYEEPTPTRKAQSSAMLLAIAVAVGATLAFALSFVVSSAVGSITGLLK